MHSITSNIMRSGCSLDNESQAKMMKKEQQQQHSQEQTTSVTTTQHTQHNSEWSREKLSKRHRQFPQGTFGILFHFMTQL